MERNSATLKLLETALFAVFSSIGIRLLQLFRYSLLYVLLLRHR